jgi:DNA-binding GntR family transcriptional regulator
VIAVSVPQTKSRYAYDRLREQIVAGALAPGERLRLRGLAESLGLSEMPVREALRMLSRDGLVEFSDHRGATVTEIPIEDVRDTISARMWLEVLAVREAVPHHDAASLAAVRSALAKGAKLTDGAKFSAVNRELHEAIEAPAPAALRAMIAEAWDRVWVVRRAASLFLLLPDQVARAHQEHARLVAAVEARDARAAAKIMERHRASTMRAWSSLD